MQTSAQLKNEWWQQMRITTNNKRLLSNSEIELIRLKITLKNNMSFFMKDHDGTMFNEIVSKIDRELYSALPNRFYSSMRDSSYGISYNEVKELRKSLNRFIGNNISIPYLSILMEKAIIKRVLDVLVGAMRKGDRL